MGSKFRSWSHESSALDRELVYTVSLPELTFNPLRLWNFDVRTFYDNLMFQFARNKNYWLTYHQSGYGENWKWPPPKRRR